MGSKKKVTKGRKVSQVKRSNQKKNKLIKKGKLKPNSKSIWIQNQQEKQVKTKVRQQNDLEKKRIRDEQDEEDKEEEEEEDMDDMMDPEDALFLSGKQQSGRNRKKEDENLKNLETQACQRYGMEKSDLVEKRDLLPIKTTKGLILRTEEVDQGFHEEMEVEEEEEENEEEEEGDGSVVNLEDFDVDALKLDVGFMASGFLENPEEKSQILERLIQMMEMHTKIPVGFKIISATVNELLKDVIPGYKISFHNEEGTMQKKETLKLQGFEKTILNCAKAHLTKLEKQIKRLNNPRNDLSLGIHCLQCICDLLVTHPQFNYSPNIIKLVVPSLDSKNERINQVVKTSFETLFRNDKRGEISLEAVKNIKNYVKAKKYRCKAPVLECMLQLKLHYIDSPNNPDEDGKKKKHNKDEMSRKEKKRKKQLEKVEREMLIAKGEESKSMRNKYFTEAAKILFEMLFRIIKNTENNRTSVRLMPSALKCISRFCHAINVEFFDDLLIVLSTLLKDESIPMTNQDKLLCIKTAFDILTGPGEFLTYDPGNFAKVLYDILPQIDTNCPGNSSIICSVIKNMIIKRKKHASKDLIHSFVKALAFVCLQVSDDECMDFLEMLSAIKACHVRTFEALLDTEDEIIPSNVSGFSHPDVDIKSLALWEIQMLKHHYHKDIRQMAKKLCQIKDN